jgi:hypothetical protein
MKIVKIGNLKETLPQLRGVKPEDIANLFAEMATLQTTLRGKPLNVASFNVTHKNSLLQSFLDEVNEDGNFMRGKLRDIIKLSKV